MLHTKFQGHQSIGSGEEDFLGFYHIWALRPGWLYDPTRAREIVGFAGSGPIFES